MIAEDRLIARIGIPIEHRYFDVNGRRSHCVIAGSGSPVVLVHGLNVGWGEWYAVLRKLAAHHTVYALDLPGAGHSDKIDFLATDVAKLFHDTVDVALRTFTPKGAAVIGHSLGAWSALKLAASGHPSITTVIAVSSVGLTDFLPMRFRLLAIRPIAKFVSTHAVPVTRANIEMFLGDVMADASCMAPEYVDYVFEHVSVPPTSHPFLLIHSLFKPFRFRPEFLLSTDELRSIKRPVTFVHGELDPLIPLANVCGRFGDVPTVKVDVLARTGHVPPIEQPEAFISICEAALAGPL